MFTLFTRAGWGSMMVEAQLDWYGLDYRLEEVGDLFASPEAREALSKVNPLAQIPTLLLPDGSVMTESAAITLYLADFVQGPSLAPPPGSAQRARFLRWLVFIVANIYPTFTYADDPSRFVSVPEAQAPFRDAVDRYGERLWRMVEEEAGAPWFLGDTVSALDIYIGAMTHWRPRRAWFAAHCPRLHAIATQVDAEPKLARFWARNVTASEN